MEFSRKSLPLRPFHPNCVQSHSARVRTRARSKHFQSLTAGNFEALWSLDFKFSAFKDLFPFSIVSKVQDASSILKVVFALSKRPHLHRAYLVTVSFRSFIAVHINFLRQKCFKCLQKWNSLLIILISKKFLLIVLLRKLFLKHFLCQHFISSLKNLSAKYKKFFNSNQLLTRIVLLVEWTLLIIVARWIFICIIEIRQQKDF